MSTTYVSLRTVAETAFAFWSELHGELAPVFYEPEAGIALLVESLNQSASGADIWLGTDAIGRFHQEIFSRVRKELEPRGHLLFANPTTLGRGYIEALDNHSAAIKRECLGKGATRAESFFLKEFDFREYDVESDIARTAETLKRKERELFGLEIDFLDAMMRDRLEAAADLLPALLEKRRTADVRRRTELNNWHLMLAFKRKDLDMFVSAWNARVPNTSSLKPVLMETLRIVIHSCLVKEFLISPSVDGLTKCFMQGQQKFADEQIALFRNGALSELADKMATADRLTVESFTELVWRTLESRRRLFISLNPLVDNVQCVPLERSP